MSFLEYQKKMKEALSIKDEISKMLGDEHTLLLGKNDYERMKEELMSEIMTDIRAEFPQLDEWEGVIDSLSTELAKTRQEKDGKVRELKSICENMIAFNLSKKTILGGAIQFRTRKNVVLDWDADAAAAWAIEKIRNSDEDAEYVLSLFAPNKTKFKKALEKGLDIPENVIKMGEGINVAYNEHKIPLSHEVIG